MVRPAVGATCGLKGLAQCNEGYACLGPDLQLSAAFNHTCALADDGKVWCWGQNVERQLGNASTARNADNPVTVIGLPEPAIAISAGYTHTCALVEGGEAYCWGDNSFGKADPDSSDAIVETARPVRTPGVTFSAIRAAGSHTCALATDATVFCWGATDAGQCGVDGNRTGVSQVGPTRVPNLDEVTVVESVKNHSCALRRSPPSLVCWGDNRFIEGGGYIVHKLGPNAAGLDYSAIPVPVDLGSQVLYLGLGYDSTYARASDGLTYAFGLNDGNRLGTGSTEPVSATPSPVKVLGNQGLAEGLEYVVGVVRAGAGNQCVRMADYLLGSRYLCWGTDERGEMGMGAPVGQTQRYATPTTVLPISADNMVHGESHACVTVILRGRTEIWCYGNPALVGNGTVLGVQNQTSPTSVVWDPANFEGI